LLRLVILATSVADIGRIAVRGQPGQIVHEITSQPIKAVQGGAHLSYQLRKKNK
jgi:hypothetical protein